MFQRPQDKSPIMPTILLDTKGSGEIIFWLWHLGLSISCIGPASFTFSRFELVLNSPSPPAHHLHLMLSVTLGWTQQTERWLDKPFTNLWNTERKATLCHCWLRRTWQSGLNTRTNKNQGSEYLRVVKRSSRPSSGPQCRAAAQGWCLQGAQ